LHHPAKYHIITFKGEGHSKKPTFLVFTYMASKHSAFPLTKVSASEVPNILKKFSKEATLEAAILKLSKQPGRVYVMSFRPT